MSKLLAFHGDVVGAVGWTLTQERIGARLRQPPEDVDRLLAGTQPLLVPPEVGVPKAEIAHTHRQIGQERIGARLRQPPIDVDRLLGGGQRLLVPPEDSEPKAEIAQAARQIGQERIGARLRQPPIDVDRLLGGGQRLLVPPQFRGTRPRTAVLRVFPICS
jgi:hypothetical protein